MGWLLSRNDVLTNVAVIIAALFLHSAWEIIRNSLVELRGGGSRAAVR